MMLEPNATLILEVFTEELPPKSLPKLSDAFTNAIFNSLKKAQLLSADSKPISFASPRRLAVQINGVLNQAADYAVREKILPTSIAFDSAGKPTAPLLKKLAALGSADIDLNTLERSGEGKNETLFLNLQATGAQLTPTLQLALESALQQLPIAKMMHYQVVQKNGDLKDVAFARPVHRILALHGKVPLQLEGLGITADQLTEGHRFLSAGAIKLTVAHDYERVLETQGKVVANFVRRRTLIQQGLTQAAGEDLVLMPDALLDEVTALVEWPVIYRCQFDPEFLEIPQECLILTMQTNQKYFALTDQQGKLRNRFLIVSNIETVDPSAIIAGNERVIRPRLADARFFYQQDQKRSLYSRLDDLNKVVYQNQLGSQLERMRRVQAIALQIAADLNRQGLAINTEWLSRAAEIAKADLLTDMVGEFPELQGIMGRYYAALDGETAEVAAACGEHYQPRFAGDTLPLSLTGTVLALADKLETLVGIWGIGLAPTGDKDPYALRRNALGICRLLVEKNLAINLPIQIDFARSQFKQTEVAQKANTSDIYQFIADRFPAYLRDQAEIGGTFTAPEIDAVLSQMPPYFNDVIARLQALRQFNALPEAAQLAAANKRISNILKKTSTPIPTNYSSKLLVLPAEIALVKSLEAISTNLDLAYQAGEFVACLQILVSLAQPIDHFFADVMVMDPRPELRDNRLALLQQLHQKMNLIADLGKLA